MPGSPSAMDAGEAVEGDAGDGVGGDLGVDDPAVGVGRGHGARPLASVSTARGPSPQSATGVAGPPPPVKLWPVLTAPGLSSVGPVQVKSPYVDPVPVSWSDSPAGSRSPRRRRCRCSSTRPQVHRRRRTPLVGEELHQAARGVDQGDAVGRAILDAVARVGLGQDRVGCRSGSWCRRARRCCRCRARRSTRSGRRPAGLATSTNSPTSVLCVVVVDLVDEDRRTLRERRGGGGRGEDGQGAGDEAEKRRGDRPRRRGTCVDTEGPFERSLGLGRVRGVPVGTRRDG